MKALRRAVLGVAAVMFAIIFAVVVVGMLFVYWMAIDWLISLLGFTAPGDTIAVAIFFPFALWALGSIVWQAGGELERFFFGSDR